MFATQREVITNQRIFVTDDDPAIRMFLEELLIDESYTEVRWVARSELVAEARREPPAVLLLDVHGAQPSDGRALLGELRGNPRTATVAVIICSTMRREAWQQQIVRNDAGDGFLEKPFHVAELMGLILRLLGPPVCDVAA